MDGILNVYKEKGYTSHDVVARVRGITGERHIGHTGTLDPEAVGVLVVCVGRATKLVDTLMSHEKVYEANNTVMVHIRRLRGKMKEDTRTDKIITTVWGVGYKIEK